MHVYPQFFSEWNGYLSEKGQSWTVKKSSDFPSQNLKATQMKQLIALAHILITTSWKYIISQEFQVQQPKHTHIRECENLPYSCLNSVLLGQNFFLFGFFFKWIYDSSQIDYIYTYKCDFTRLPFLYKIDAEYSYASTTVLKSLPHQFN